jgi:DUF438 domain-containing protein
MAPDTTLIDAKPLLTALERIAAMARHRKEQGIDDEAVRYGRIANAALLWKAADEAGEIEQAARYLKQVQGG